MEYTNLGRTGLSVSRLCLGTMNFGPVTEEADSFAIMDRALEHGINFFDTANVYGWKLGEGITEQIIGRWFAQGGGRRDKVVLATKFCGRMGEWPNEQGLSARHIVTACEASLRRLQTDAIDLYQMHHVSRTTPWDEIWQAMELLVAQGKVRYIGSSNFAGWQVANSAWIARTASLTPFVSAQNHYSWLDRTVEADLVPACTHFGVGLLPFFPLASGLLTGKYKRDTEAPQGTRLSFGPFADLLAGARWDVIEAMESFAAQRTLGLLDVAIGGLAAKPAVGSVIAGATSGDQVRANVSAGAWMPTAEELAELDKITAK
jgi:NDP-hexose C3-ketoreductase / dTDP-4-oxo-2-deoxy-alpha-D-pentos-2-ene 2,3-reductase